VKASATAATVHLYACGQSELLLLLPYCADVKNCKQQKQQQQQICSAEMSERRMPAHKLHNPARVSTTRMTQAETAAQSATVTTVAKHVQRCRDILQAL
jgi:hypothetical protein